MDEAGGLLPVGSSAGEDFFDKDGNLSPALKTMGEYLAQVEAHLLAADKAVAALAEAGVIVPWPINVKTEQGEQPFEGLRRDNQDENPATIRMRMRCCWGDEGRA
jgi:hypothetical protein